LTGRADCANETVHTEIGLDFRIQCQTRVIATTVRDVGRDDFDACLEWCSEQANPVAQVCSWSIDGKRCYLKEKTSFTQALEYSPDYITLFADSAALENRSSDCPYANGTIQSDENGLQYRIFCQTDYPGNDFGCTSCSSDSSSNLSTTPFHTDTLLECMNICSWNDPLCYGAVWLGNLVGGYRNCFHKRTNVSDDLTELVRNTNVSFAMAVLPVANIQCTDTIYTSPTGAAFNRSCGTNGGGPLLDRIHAVDFEGCMNACADYQPQHGEDRCATVGYNPTSEGGFFNCNLRPYLSSVTPDPDWRTARMVSNNDSSPSRTWIAGAAIGPAVGVALVGALLFWCYRRRKSKNGSNAKTSEAEALTPANGIHKDKPAALPPYSVSKPELDSQSTQLLPEMSPRKTPVAELPGSIGRPRSGRVEMTGS
jgi:hypothetical protein